MPNAKPTSKITDDALAIWRAGVDAVRADNIVRSQVFADRRTIQIEDREWILHPSGRLIVIGAGKAAFMMTKGLLEVVESIDPAIEIVGWINVPEGTATESLDPRVHVCEARPPGVNEPTPKVLEGTKRIVELVQSAGPHDTVVFLLTGGGSALLSSPVEGITLEEKLAVIRHLSHSGAKIEELNAVRRALSRVKGGGLVNGCRAGNWITLIISDVLGDPLEAIASGPTIVGLKNDPSETLRVLERFDPGRRSLPSSVYRVIESGDGRWESVAGRPHGMMHVDPANIVLANNATAVDAAGIEAVRRGYAYWMQSSRTSEGPAEDVGRELAHQVLGLVDQPKIQCLITGGEPSVVLPPSDRRGKGGRNQHLVLAALDELLKHDISEALLKRLVILSGGTDGEDGPTDAAGAWLDEAVLRRVAGGSLDVASHLARCDAYHFFKQTDSLLQTGPTHTNVCDIRVAILAGD